MQLALAYAKLPDIDETQSLNEADKMCMEEVRDVLSRHGKLNRFGLTLLHQHFPVYEDEMLVETCNPHTREPMTRVVPKTDVNESSVVETSWRLSDSAAVFVCKHMCGKENGRHVRTHYHEY